MKHHVAGVFEGGGAKGIAYIGVLERLAEEGIWFRRVAGASAGALAAALVASGATSAEIRTGMDQLLAPIRKVAARKARRLVRLYWHGGMFSNRALHIWLENWFAHQVRGTPLPDGAGAGEYVSPDNPITFRELFDATGIELNVVAANISLQRQMVFSHHETPSCQVSDAVMASASLPFAFRNSDLVAMNDDDGKQYIHTLVDGGVWSNFPIWIFTDDAFADWSERTEVPSVDGVVGFVLREPRPDESLGDVKFHRYRKSDGLVGKLPVPAFEWRADPEVSILNALPLLAPTRILDNLGVRTFSRGRWPAPKRRIPRFFGAIVESWLRLMTTAPVGAAILLAALYGGYVAYHWAQHRSAVENGLFTVGITAVEAVYLLGGVAITLLTLFLLNFLLGTSIRRIGYGLVRTFAAAPGAPQWIEKRNDVIAVALPPEATTLNFGLDPEILIDAGRSAVETNLGALRARLDSQG